MINCNQSVVIITYVFMTYNIFIPFEITVFLGRGVRGCYQTCVSHTLHLPFFFSFLYEIGLYIYILLCLWGSFTGFGMICTNSCSLIISMTFLLAEIYALCRILLFSLYSYISACLLLYTGTAVCCLLLGGAACRTMYINLILILRKYTRSTGPSNEKESPEQASRRC